MILELDLLPTQDCDLDVGVNATVHAAAAGKLDLAVVQANIAGTIIGIATPKATIDGLIGTYTGYADGVITWGSPTRGAGDKGEIPGTTPEFRPSDGVTPNMIGSFAVYNAAKTKVYFVANVPGVGLPMKDALDHFDLSIDFLPSGASKLLVTI